MTTVQNHEATPSSGHIFRPESLDHFKDVAKDLSWLLGQPLQACHEALARVYGFGSMHEVLQVLRHPGQSGPFEARFGVDPGSPEDDVLAKHERRIAHVLGVAGWLKEDKHWLVFELGLFVRASEQREYAGKVRLVLSLKWDGWLPTTSGRALGWRAWKCKWWAQDFEVEPGWEEDLLRGREDRRHLMWKANPAEMIRDAGYEHGEQMHLVMSDAVSTELPEHLRSVDFREAWCHAMDERLRWEGNVFIEWLEGAAQEDGNTLAQAGDSLQTFVDRPSKATAAACGVDKILPDATDVRERWAFEALTCQLGMNYLPSERPGLCVKRVRVGDDFEVVGMARRSPEWVRGGCVWNMVLSVSKVVPKGGAGAPRFLKPVAAARCSLVETFQETEEGHSPCTLDEWYRAHQVTEAASEDEAAVVHQVGMPLLFMNHLFDWIEKANDPEELMLFMPSCVVEVGEMLLGDESEETLRALFQGMVSLWRGNWIDDGWEDWGQPLRFGALRDWEPRDIYEGQRRLLGDIAPAGLLVIAAEGSGGTWVHGKDKEQKPMEWMQAERFDHDMSPDGEALSAKIRRATTGLGIDVIVSDTKARLTGRVTRHALLKAAKT